MPYLLAGWTVLVWVGRVRNVLATDGGAADLIVPALLVTLGVATVVQPKRFGPHLAVVTAAVWLIRVPLLLAHHHAAAFVVVHLVLAAVSLGLAALVLRLSLGQWRERTRRPVRA